MDKHSPKLLSLSSPLTACVLLLSFYSIATPAEAACPSNLATNTRYCTNSAGSRCTLSYFAANYGPSAPSSDPTAIDRAAYCLNSGSDCCDDPCAQYTSRDACALQSSCMGGGYQDSLFVCVSREKVCGMLTYNATICATSFFCKMENDFCVFSPPTPSDAAPASTADCPALHPFVIVMILFIFVTFFASIITIAVMMAVIRRRAEEEERLEEERAAEAAISQSRRKNDPNYVKSNDSTKGGAGGVPLAHSSSNGKNTTNHNPHDGYYDDKSRTWPHNNNATAGGYSPTAGGATASAPPAPPAAEEYGYSDGNQQGEYDASAGAEAYEIQYDEYGGYYDANGIYWDAQGNAYGADGQPLAADAAAAAASGGAPSFDDDDY